MNRKFKTNQYPWSKWIFDLIIFPPNAKVLELGCGTRMLWKSNIGRIKHDVHIVLTDFSRGMIEDAKINLNSNSENFESES